MGALQSRSSSPEAARRHPLPGLAIVGRSSRCYLQLDHPRVSGEHALIRWGGEGWLLQDLHSRNGTFVDQVCLKPGAAVPLKPGVELSFGASEPSFTFRDDAPPELIAMHTPTRNVRVAERDLLVLPSPQRPEVTLFHDASGALMVERADGATPLGSQTNLVVGDDVWLVFPPAPGQATSVSREGLVFDDASFHFDVEPDEAVTLTIVQQATPYKLESREHTYLLLLLARARLAERDRPVEDRGWVARDDLLRMLKVDMNALDVGIHRARRQLAEAGMVNAAHVVQIKRGFKRFGTERFIIAPA